MADFPSVSDVDPVAVADQAAVVKQYMLEQVPDIDLSQGILSLLVVDPVAAFAARDLAQGDIYLRSRSLVEIEADPAIADDAVVDGVARNFGVVRKAGDAASGQATIVVADNLTVTIGEGAGFTADGRRFITTAAYTAKSEDELVTADTDRTLVADTAGNYRFTIPLVAEGDGSAYFLRRNAALSPEQPIRAFVAAYAASDFTGGADRETNAELLARMRAGVSARAMAGRTSMDATMRAAFDRDGLASSIIGAGDPEMLRDRRGLWPASAGGCADWYVRTAVEARTTRLARTATLLAKGADGGTWSVSLDRDEAAGVYELSNFRPAASPQTDGGGECLSLARTASLTDYAERKPDIATQQDCAFSRFQSLLATFSDTELDVTDLAVGDTAAFEVDVIGMPDIAAIQDYFGDRRNVAVAGDILIKAPIPCFVDVDMVVVRKAGETVDSAAVARTVAESINAVGFTGRLFASNILADLRSLFGDRLPILRFFMFGRIVGPDGEFRWLRDGTVLEIPDLPDVGITSRTTQFLSDETRIGVTVSLDTVAEA